MDPNLNNPRMDGSYIYEEFINVDNGMHNPAILTVSWHG